MKPVKLILMTSVMTLAACGGGTTQQAGNGATEDAPVIGHQDIRIEGKRLTPEALWAMGRIGNVSPSADGRQIAYSVAYYSVPQNRSNNELFVMQADGSGNRQLTQDNYQQSQPTWMNDGRLAYLSNESGSSQVWAMQTDGSDRVQLTDYEGDIEGFSFSPDGRKLLFIAQVKTVKSTADKYPDLPKASGIIVSDLMYKHWDEWVTTAPHPFVADFNGKGISNIRDILQGQPYESPMKSFGGIEQLAWSPASDMIAYTCRKKTGLDYALSTDSDIYLYSLSDGSTVNLCKDYPQNGDRNMGYDVNPQFSPDGRYIAWQSMARDGYESDRNRLCLFNLTDHSKRYVTEQFDSNVDGFIWNDDSQSLYFTGVWHGTIEGKTLTKLTDGLHDYGSLALAGDRLIATRHSMSQADEIYSVSKTRNGEAYAEALQLTRENQAIYDQVEMGKVEERWITTTDGKQMLVWVIYPPQFDPNRKYPTLLYCEGGPQTPLSQFWSFRWNFQMMAANDYIVVAPCRRGMPGFGSQWNEAISGDYGGQCMRDYLKAIDEVSKEPFVDKNHRGCVGASFGGFSVYWMAGHHDKRFKAFIAHDGIFNMEMQYLETEEKWFANWDMGGAYWEKNNPTAQRTFANSPHRFVDKWDTPILCIHGERDYRILANQAMAAFDAAKMRGVPAELLIFPDENHWVLKPQNGILWQRTFFEWLDRWLKK